MANVGKHDPRPRPNVYDVATQAGVSIATVSRVLTGSAPVADSKRRAVLRAADELQWRPNRLARAFVEQSHGAVGLVFPDLAGPYFARVIAGFEREAAERRTAALILATHGRDNAAELVRDLADRVDGLVVMGRTVPDDDVAALERPHLPVVLLARPPIGAIPAVRAPSLAAADALARHLLDHGRRHIVFVGDPDLSPDVSERWRGVRRALRRAGRRIDNALVPCGGFDIEHGYKSGLALFESGRRLDGVMCANDEVAAGVHQAASTNGWRVPDDVSITGWDDTPVAGRLHPPLTTVAQPMHELGARAASLLFDRIDGGAAASVALRSSIVVRGSCGHHRRERRGDGSDHRDHAGDSTTKG